MPKLGGCSDCSAGLSHGDAPLHPMCLVVYVGCMAPLRLVQWTDTAPAFNVRPLAVHEEPVRRLLPLTYLALLGAHTGCGCGFIMDGADEPADVRRSRESLARYVIEAIGNGPTELYVCWNGDEALPSERHLTITPGELPVRDDWLQERTHVRLVP